MKTIQNILILNMILFAFEAHAYNQLERVVNLRGYWKFNIGDKQEWADYDFDDSQWSEIFVPSPWENEGFHGYDGFAWYRVAFELDPFASKDGHSYYLDLGYIDDVDQVYINGQLIGFTGSMPPNFHTAFNSHRLYHIPREVLNSSGYNTIAVRVFDTVLDGGIVSGKVGIYRREGPPDQVAMLEGIWKFQFGTSDSWQERGYDDSNWQSVLVPGFWAGMKNEKSKSTGTYRKTFRLSDHMRDADDLLLILGRIDDFDKTYLNGQLIGVTNDGGAIFRTNSWRTYRIYPLTESYLDRYGDNVITVEVEDLGGNAGIYEGPIAITTLKNYKRLIENYR